MVKRKRLTISEKKMNAKVRTELRAEGIIPPIKPKLNRKKFAEDVIKDYRENLNKYDDIRYLYEAIGWMIPSTNTEYKQKISLEQIGVLKVLKAAMEIKKFIKQKSEKGEEKYSVEELYKNVINPIIKL
jgi:hypothetical protein